MSKPEPSVKGCKQCGKCCRFSWNFAVVKTGDFDADKLALFQGGIDAGYLIFLDLPCRYLDLKTNLCKIHDSVDRPECCKRFGPDNETYHPDGCAFQNFNHDSYDWKLRNGGRWKGKPDD